VEIQCFQGVKIKLTGSISWGFVPIDKIVVQRKRDRLQPVNPKLSRQALGKLVLPEEVDLR
jgi:hypothetical protein